MATSSHGKEELAVHVAGRFTWRKSEPARLFPDTINIAVVTVVMVKPLKKHRAYPGPSHASITLLVSCRIPWKLPFPSSAIHDFAESQKVWVPSCHRSDKGKWFGWEYLLQFLGLLLSLNPRGRACQPTDPPTNQASAIFVGRPGKRQQRLCWAANLRHGCGARTVTGQMKWWLLDCWEYWKCNHGMLHNHHFKAIIDHVLNQQFKHC